MRSLLTTDKTVSTAGLYAADAKSIKDLMDSIDTLTSAIGSGVKIRYGRTAVTFGTDGNGLLNHNCGFSSANSYSLTYNLAFSDYEPTYSYNQNGNQTKLIIHDPNGRKVSLTESVNWIAIGI